LQEKENNFAVLSIHHTCTKSMTSLHNLYSNRYILMTFPTWENALATN